jgi:hypothetical protein
MSAEAFEPTSGPMLGEMVSVASFLGSRMLRRLRRQGPDGAALLAADAIETPTSLRRGRCPQLVSWRSRCPAHQLPRLRAKVPET